MPAAKPQCSEKNKADVEIKNETKMTDEQRNAQKKYAGEKKASMKRRDSHHDYRERRMYMITLEVEGRRPLFGRVVGNAYAEQGSRDEPRIELTELGKAVQSEWMSIHGFYPQIEVMAVQMMPDHMHGILFVTDTLPVHLGQVISGFKAGCRKAQRALIATEEERTAERAAAEPLLTEKARQGKAAERAAGEKAAERRAERAGERAGERAAAEPLLTEKARQEKAEPLLAEKTGQGKAEGKTAGKAAAEPLLTEKTRQEKAEPLLAEKTGQGKAEGKTAGKAAAEPLLAEKTGQGKTAGKAAAEPLLTEKARQEKAEPLLTEKAKEEQEQEGKEPLVSQYATALPLPEEAGANCALFAKGYNDLILRSFDELPVWQNYLRDNPRRLLLKRARPEWLRPFFGLQIGSHTYNGIGNRLLLTACKRKTVLVSRRLTDSMIEEETARYLELAKQGTVLVSAAISPGEKRVMRAVFDAGYPTIVIMQNGFTPMSKPHGRQFDACASGALLMLSPWEHHNEKQKITAVQCRQMNLMALEICEN
jgi:hypothetical protein